ncbi:Subtilisin-like protease [Acorus calamus]|uniref:Subtilisin-like protease n=1 Tax=Acorus calamus TaxID=4465 RepID=A0AAV9DF38_ACOCL|nr:Subtilisin-like protease [Acorus calamus]
MVGLSSTSYDHRRTYIIHMDKSAMPAPFTDHETWYKSMLMDSGNSDHPPIHLYTYDHAIHGFSAVLSPSQLDRLRRSPGHLAAYPDTFGKLHTTRTPTFLGLRNHAGLWPAARFGEGLVIGIIDTGVWPESPSLDDRGMPPPPAGWRGACEDGAEFNASMCNRKLIGARSFSEGMKRHGINISSTDDYDSPRDYFGHGSHTSSTAAGARVRGADYFGYAKGTASGLAPGAHVAMYKAIFANDDSDPDAAGSDVLAAMDRAIRDGVDAMSLSLGFPNTVPYDKNVIALGAYAAMEKGIFVSCSAGNAGPHAYTMFNGAPWITTVGAGTIDRDYAASISLGNYSETVQGRSMYPLSLYVSGVPIYYARDGNATREGCAPLSLNASDVSGKVLLCTASDGDETDTVSQIDEGIRVGAKVVIVQMDDASFLRFDEFPTPYIAVKTSNIKRIKSYIQSSSAPTVDITFQVTILGAKPAPRVAYFSSRGPNRVSPHVLKPDVLAPGVNVLAAWAPNRGRVPLDDDYLTTDYALVSGTSMASPHIVGVAALIKTVHRDWSPAAIRSAIMTTARISDNAGGPILDMTSGTAGTPLDYGAGHVDPERAVDPGLVYDMGPKEYVDFLCGLNYTARQIKTITRTANFSCAEANIDLNYPSFMLILYTNTTSQSFRRVLTNVADGSGVYRAVVEAPRGMKVVVEPQILSFEGKFSKGEFVLSVDVDMGRENVRVDSDYIGNYGYISWVEVGGKHVVRSPIVSAYAP